MARTANVMTRIEPEIKEMAEEVLNQLGISMSTAMSLYLKQIALQKKIPFEISLPTQKPISLGELSNGEFDALMDKAVTSYANGLCADVSDFKKELKEEIGL